MKRIPKLNYSNSSFNRRFAAGFAAAALGFGLSAAARAGSPEKASSPPYTKTVLKEPKLVVHLLKSNIPERLWKEIIMKKKVIAELETAPDIESAAVRLQNRLDSSIIDRINFIVREEINKNPLLQKQFAASWELEQKNKAWKGISISLAGILALVSGYSLARKYLPAKPRNRLYSKKPLSKKRLPVRTRPAFRQTFFNTFAPRRTQHRPARRPVK